MSKKRYRPEEIVNKLREADVLIGLGPELLTSGGSILSVFGAGFDVEP